MPSSRVSFLRQLSGRDGWNTSSMRWSNKNRFDYNVGGDQYERNLTKMQGMNYMYGDENGGGGGFENGFIMRKRVMVVVDQSSCSKHAMMWALTHLTNKGDLLTLLHIIPPHSSIEESCSPYLANSLGTLCKASKPEVEVEALVIQGARVPTVMSQVKKLEVSVLVLGQKKPSAVFNCFCLSSNESFVDECINNAECLTLGVRKQSRGMGGYLISSRWQKNFWLLA
ncbi:Adenine nucleotide alpha hydrolases-like superfamily protein [Thalictrum thalictroides]|uniref:Adenine nucleotide alpha hydrolases-like superfamily protein n=1 Tax=Thalictrum thalictroides TaxID=46969 RepID=A0A7J6WS68_THATH|nr:Adenine nucleotide alpha hydrolases-like superfamily protein [Thalictrum thalictroides]